MGKIGISLAVLAAIALSGCSWLGRSEAQVYREIDANHDGKITQDEIKASKYDLNKDGVLSAEELGKATKEHPAVSLAETGLEIAGALGVPFIGIAVAAWRRQKKNVQALVAGGEAVLEAYEKGGLKDRETIKTVMREAQENYGAGKALYEEIAKIKAEIRGKKA